MMAARRRGLWTRERAKKALLELGYTDRAADYALDGYPPRLAELMAENRDPAMTQLCLKLGPAAFQPWDRPALPAWVHSWLDWLWAFLARVAGARRSRLRRTR